MEFITDQANPPAGHYSQAVVHGGFVFLSGILPSRHGQGRFADEVVQTLQKCNEVLELAGCEKTDIVQCTAYIVGVENWPEFNRVYADFFGDHKPARTVVPVAELHHGCLVEIQVTAARSS